MARPKVYRNANIELRPNGETHMTLSVTIKPQGRWSVNGQLRHQALTAMKDVADAMSWLEYTHGQRKG